MLSPNLLRTQIPYTVGKERTFDAKLKSAKDPNPNSLYGGGRGPAPAFDAEFKYAKNPNSLYNGGGGGGEGSGTNFWCCV